MLTRFYARNYKGLQMEPLALGQVNLFIGPNNCGKSNLFSAVSFFFDMFGRPEEARGTLQAALRRREHSPLATRGQTEVDLSWDFDTPPMKYATGLVNGPDEGVSIGTERVERFSNESDPIWVEIRVDGSMTWNRIAAPRGFDSALPLRLKAWPRTASILHAPVELDALYADSATLSQWHSHSIHSFLGNTGEGLEHLAQSSLYVHLSNFVPADIARTKKAARAEVLDERGLELTNMLHTMLKDSAVHDRLVSELGPLLPGLEKLHVFEGGGSRWIRLKLHGDWLDLSELSDGTVILVTLAALLFGPKQRETLCLDEPELNLHPAWARVVAGWILRQTAWKQVLVGTHSPEILDPLTEHFQRGEVSLFVFQRAEEGYKLEPCPPDRLAASLEEGWLLGDLYRVGDPALGGWPW